LINACSESGPTAEEVRARKFVLDTNIGNYEGAKIACDMDKKEGKTNTDMCRLQEELASTIVGDKERYLSISSKYKGKDIDIGNLTESKPSIPVLTVEKLLDLNKNEIQEIERRCIGISHVTCENLKSDGYKKLWELKKSLCKTGKTLDKFTGSVSDSNDCQKYQ